MPFITKARKRNDPVLRSPTAKLNKYEQEIYDIYYKALSSMPKDLDNSSVLRTIREAVEAGNPMDAAIAFRWQDFITSLDKTVPKLAQQVASSANISAKSLPKRIRVESSFTAQDPRAIAWAQKRAGARILGITKETQKAVAETIVRSLKTQLKREEVIDRITKIVGLDARQAKALGNFYEKNLNDLLEEGYGYEEAVKIVTKLSKEYRDRLLVQRATRIARTETVNAANAGRYLSWVEADAQGLLPTGSQKRWKTTRDERVCSVCGPLHNLTIDWEEAFPTGDVMPTNHPNCRCTAVIVPADPVFEKVVEKRYYRFADGEETWRNYDYRWRKIANEMKRRIGKCQRCGSKSDLTVDHKKRLKDGGAKYDRKNLRVLCRSCNGRASRLGTKLRKEAESWWLVKHAPGKHDQKTHGRRGGSGGAGPKNIDINKPAGTATLPNGKTYNLWENVNWIDDEDGVDNQNIERGAGLVFDNLNKDQVLLTPDECDDYMTEVLNKYGYGNRVFSTSSDGDKQFKGKSIEAAVAAGLTNKLPSDSPFKDKDIPVFIVRSRGTTKISLLHEAAHMMEGSWKLKENTPQRGRAGGGHSLRWYSTWVALLDAEGFNQQANLLKFTIGSTENKGVLGD